MKFKMFTLVHVGVTQVIQDYPFLFQTETESESPLTAVKFIPIKETKETIPARVWCDIEEISSEEQWQFLSICQKCCGLVWTDTTSQYDSFVVSEHTSGFLIWHKYSRN